MSINIETALLKPSRKTNGAFMNSMKKAWANMPQSKVQNAIDTQYFVMHEILENGGRATKYLNCH